MSSVLAVPADRSVAAPPVRPGALHGFGGRHIALILGFALFVPSVQTLFALALGETWRASALLAEFLGCLAIGISAQLSAIAGQNLLHHRMGAALRVTLAIVVATAGAGVLMALAYYAVAVPFGVDRLMLAEGKSFASAAHRVVYFAAGALRWSLVLVVLCELLEASRRAQDELHKVRMAALGAERDLVEGKLRAMQARVDPDLLFDSLENIDQGYARDGALGQARLDALIRFLRAALPSDGNSGSSVGREQELVAAYVALNGHRSARHLELEFAVPPEVQQEPLPAMLLLPVVRWAIDGGDAQRAMIAVSRASGGLAIAVESDAAAAAAPDPVMRQVRERLARLFPEGADVRVSASGAVRRALLTIPPPQPAA